MRSTFWPNRICEGQICQNRHTDLRSLEKGKTVRFPWKLYKTLLLGHEQHVLAKSHLWASKFSKSSHWPQILCKTGKQCAFDENCTKRSFQLMRSTFWPNRIFERQSSQIRQTGLKFSPKVENSAVSMKIVQNARFRSCAARFGQIAFVRVKVLKIVTLAWKSLQKEKTVRSPWKLYKTLFSGHAEHVLAKSHLWASKLSKSSHWPQILSKKRKQCAFHKNCTKRSFQVMRSTFWPNRICERQSVKNRHTGLKISPKRQKSALIIKIVQNPLFRSWAARFGQIAFVSVKVLKIVTLASNSLQNGKTVRFPRKLYKTLFSGHAEHVLAKSHLWASKFSKSSHWPENLSKKAKKCAYYKNCTKPSFQVMSSTFWPNRIFERQRCQIRHTGLKFSSKRENSALSMKIVQNPLFRWCGGRFRQIAFVSVKVLKIVTLAWKSLQKGKKSALIMKIVQNPLSRSWAARFGKIAFLRVKLLKIVTLVSNSLRNGRNAKTVRFPIKLYKTFFIGHAQHVLAKSHLWGSKC